MKNSQDTDPPIPSSISRYWSSLNTGATIADDLRYQPNSNTEYWFPSSHLTRFRYQDIHRFNSDAPIRIPWYRPEPRSQYWGFRYWPTPKTDPSNTVLPNKLSTQHVKMTNFVFNAIIIPCTHHCILILWTFVNSIYFLVYSTFVQTIFISQTQPQL